LGWVIVLSIILHKTRYIIRNANAREERERGRIIKERDTEKIENRNKGGMSEKREGIKTGRREGVGEKGDRGQGTRPLGRMGRRCGRKESAS